MKASLRITPRLLLASLAAAALPQVVTLAAESPLFQSSMSMRWVGEPQSKAVKMTFEEVDRTDKTSVVEVSGVTAKADAFAGFLLGSMCDLAKTRRQRFFQAREISKDPLTYEVVFLTTPPDSAAVPVNAIAPNVFSVAYCPASKSQ